MLMQFANVGGGRASITQAADQVNDESVGTMIAICTKTKYLEHCFFAVEFVRLMQDIQETT